MSPLVGHELRRRWPYAAAGLSLGLIGPWIAAGLAQSTLAGADAEPLLEAGGPVGVALNTLVFLVLLQHLALESFARDRDRGLDQSLLLLPLPASALLVARLTAAAGLATLVPAGRWVAALAQALVLAGPLPLLSGLLVELSQAALLLALVIVLAPWRRLAWAGLGLVVIASLIAAQEGAPGQGLGGRGLLSLGLAPPWTAVSGMAPWLAALVVLAAVQLRRLQRGRDPLQPLAAQLEQGRAGGILRRLADVTTLVLAVGLPLGLVARGSAPAGQATTPSQSFRTQHYLFRYPPLLAPKARDLAVRADEVHEGVRQLLVSTDHPSGRLELRLALASGRGPRPAPARRGRRPQPSPDAAGLELPPSPEAVELALLELARRTALASLRASSNNLRPDHPELGVWVQGVARYAAWKIVGADPFRSRLHAAIVHSRQPFAASEVRDFARLSRERGPEIAAPLGEVLVQALTELAGEAALPTLVSQLTARRPRLSAFEDRLGVSEAEVWDRAMSILESEVLADPRSALDLPRINLLVGLQEAPGLRLLAVPDRDLVPGWEVVCRLVRGDQRQPASWAGEQGRGIFAFTAPESQARWQKAQAGLRPLGHEPFMDVIWEPVVARSRP